MIDANRLRELMHYDELTGRFTWLQARYRRIKSGDFAGGYRWDGYYRIRVEGRLYLGHRLAWLYVHGVWPSGEIDHIDGNPRNNALQNLRDVTHQQNIANRTRAQRGRKNQLPLGVVKSGNRFTARIMRSGAIQHLGSFATPEQAHTAYWSARG